MKTYSNPAVPHSHSLVKSHLRFVFYRNDGLSLASRFHFLVLYTPTEGDCVHIFCASRATFQLPICL